MPTKLARPKRMGPKEKLAALEYDLKRAAFIAYADGKTFQPTDADKWWARKVCKQMVMIGSVKSGQGFINYGNSGKLLLEEMDRKWPETVTATNGKPVKAYKNKESILFAKSALRGCRKKLKEIERRLAYWEPRYAKMALADKRWKETHDLINGLRNEVHELQGRIQHWKGKIGK